MSRKDALAAAVDGFGQDVDSPRRRLLQRSEQSQEQVPFSPHNSSQVMLTPHASAALFRSHRLSDASQKSVPVTKVVNLDELSLDEEQKLNLINKRLDRYSRSALKFAFLNYFLALIITGLVAAILFGIGAVPLLSLALPWLLMAGTILWSMIFISRSINKTNTAGRGVAMVISLATALLSLVSAQLFMPLEFAFIIALGAFLVNLLLYRDDVPSVINSNFEKIQNWISNLRNLKSGKNIKTAEPSPDLSAEDKHNAAKKTISLPERVVRSFFAFSSHALAIITGAILTAGLWHSWTSGLGDLLGILHLPMALGGVLGAPYILVPLMGIIFLANYAFVQRGVKSAVEYLFDSVRVIRFGAYQYIDKSRKLVTKAIFSTKHFDSINKEGNIASLKFSGGGKAFLLYMFNINSDNKNENWKTMTPKILAFVLFNCGLGLLISFIGQKAIVDFNITFITAMLPGAQFLQIAEVFTAFLIIAYLARVSLTAYRFGFVLTRISEIIYKIGDSCVKAVSSGNYKFDIKAKLKNIKIWYFNFVKDQALTHDIDSHLEKLFVLAEWKLYREAMVNRIYNSNKKWALTFYWHLTAIIIILKNALTVFSILLNAAANGMIAAQKAPAEGSWPVVGDTTAKAVSSAATSGVSAAYTAETVRQDRLKVAILENQGNTQDSLDKILAVANSEFVPAHPISQLNPEGLPVRMPVSSNSPLPQTPPRNLKPSITPQSAERQVSGASSGLESVGRISLHSSETTASVPSPAESSFQAPASAISLSAAAPATPPQLEVDTPSSSRTAPPCVGSYTRDTAPAKDNRSASATGAAEDLRPLVITQQEVKRLRQQQHARLQLTPKPGAGAEGCDALGEEADVNLTVQLLEEGLEGGGITSTASHRTLSPLAMPVEGRAAAAMPQPAMGLARMFPPFESGSGRPPVLPPKRSSSSGFTSGAPCLFSAPSAGSAEKSPNPLSALPLSADFKAAIGNAPN